MAKVGKVSSVECRVWGLEGRVSRVEGPSSSSSFSSSSSSSIPTLPHHALNRIEDEDEDEKEDEDRKTKRKYPNRRGSINGAPLRGLQKIAEKFCAGTTARLKPRRGGPVITP